MKKTYGYRKPVRRRHKAYKRYLAIIISVILLLAGIGAGTFFYQESLDKNQKQPATKIQSQQVVTSKKTFRNGYFQFADHGNWVLDEKLSKPDKFVYHKYRGLLVEHQLIVYINNAPALPDLAVSRAMPVRLVNKSSFDVINVSNPCEKYFGSSSPSKPQEVLINQALILCNPNTQDYSVILSEINGNWALNLRRFNGSKNQFIVIYRNLTMNPEPYTIKAVASSFQAL